MARSIDSKKLAEILVDACEEAGYDELEKSVTAFVGWLKKNNLLRFWRDIESDIHRVWKKRFGASKVKITTAHPMTETSVKIISKTAKGAEVTQKIDENLIGGAVLRIDDSRIDGSVAGALNKLKTSLES